MSNKTRDIWIVEYQEWVKLRNKNWDKLTIGIYYASTYDKAVEWIKNNSGAKNIADKGWYALIGEYIDTDSLDDPSWCVYLEYWGRGGVKLENQPINRPNGEGHRKHRKPRFKFKKQSS